MKREYGLWDKSTKAWFTAKRYNSAITAIEDLGFIKDTNITVRTRYKNDKPGREVCYGAFEL